ncbi:MAG: type I secretion system permease/ATPase [Rhizobiales bacterium]|nr:type I secretion system permease/ATPase [Hyphomicrobiales bacterium]
MSLLKSPFLRTLARPMQPAFLALALFSLVNTLLMLVPSVYMLQLSERVMLSRNETTLLFLTGIAIFLLALMAVVDAVRQRVLRRMSVAVDEQLSERVFTALNRSSRKLSPSVKALLLSDIGTFREFIGGPTLIHLMDVVWVPVIVALMFIVHPILGATLTLILLVTAVAAILNQKIVFTHTRTAQMWTMRSQEFARAIMRNGDAARAMGMIPALRERWRGEHRTAIGWQALAQARAEFTAATLFFLRNSQQVTLMVVGTTLYLMQLVSAGVVFAIVFIGIRALAPLVGLAASWRAIVNFASAAERIESLLRDDNDAGTHLSLPRPKGALVVSRVTLAAGAADKIVLSDVSFRLEAGRVLGVVGPSGAGKSSLAKLLVGAWRPQRGNVILAGNDITHWNPDELGQHVGYVPQEVEFLNGTVAENISRFAARTEESARGVLDAANVAAIGDVIQTLPDGFNTRVGSDGYAPSGGQRQRLALARAVYGNPALMVLDEPNSNLDSVGEQTLARTLETMRERGCTIVIITHRMNMLQYCDDVMVLNKGTIHTFGPREHITARLTSLRPPSQPAALDLVTSAG